MRIKIKNTPKGLVVYDAESYITMRLSRDESRVLNVTRFPKDTPPEVVHLEISDRCNLKCSYCYVTDKSNKEISTNAWKRIIKQLSDVGVFQVTFGGGEPTMREDLGELAQYVKSLGLTLCITSNGLLIPKIPKSVLRCFDQVNISWHAQDGFEHALAYLGRLNVNRGINFCLSKFYEQDIGMIKKVAKKQEAEILFLAYKPVSGDIKNQIPPARVYKIAKEAYEEGLRVAIDGLTCQTCLATTRFCDIDSLGNLMPCSFIREPIGNLLKEPFKKIWARRNKAIKCPYLDI